MAAAFGKGRAAGFQGPGDALADALQESVSSPMWLQYPTDKNAEKDKEAIKEHIGLINKLQGMQSNLSFPKKRRENTLGIVHERWGQMWPRQLKKADLEEWKKYPWTASETC